MPESPEIRRITEKLRSRLKGKLLLFLSWIENTKYSPILNQIWPGVQHLFPTTCLDIICRGKQIFFFLENGVAFISGLGMEGHWYYFNSNTGERQSLDQYMMGKNHRKFCLYFGERHMIKHIEWQISDTEIWYDDMLSYGNFTICNWNMAFSKMKEIGPDLLATTTPINDIHPIVHQSLPNLFFQPATLENFTAAIRLTRRSKMLLCVFLLTHQEYFSGIGNYLCVEILYRARLHPNRTIGSLTDVEITTLFSVILITIASAYQHGGLTHGTFLDPDMCKGDFPIFVYKREGQLDPNGYVIKRLNTKNGRSSYIVEELQK